MADPAPSTINTPKIDERESGVDPVVLAPDPRTPAVSGVQEAVEAVAVAALVTTDSPRVGGIEPTHVRALGELVEQLPPIVVHRATMNVIDGVHRLRAAHVRGDETIRVRFFEGSVDDAFLLAVELNRAHGLPLSAADRLAGAQRILGSHPTLSDREVARLTGLSDKTVRTIRAPGTGESERRVGRDGRVRPLDVSAGRERAAELIKTAPDASLREVARHAGVSVGTARDVRQRLANGSSVQPERGLAAARPGRARHDTGTPAPERADVKAVLHRLKGDPAMRFSQSGRAILRLLDAHLTWEDQWERLAHSIPPHCRAAASGAARRCAEQWLQFASELASDQGTSRS